MTEKAESHRRGFIAISFCVIAYALAYIQRVCIVSIADLLQNRYLVTIDKIGILASTCFYTYSILQPFAGVMVDIFQARWLVLISGLVTAIGSILVGFVPNFIAACVFRGITGIGIAFVYVAALKYITLWLCPRQFVIWTGVLTTASGVASVISSAPLRYITDALGIKWLFAGLGILSLVASTIVGIVGSYPSKYYENKGNIVRAATTDFRQGFQSMVRTRALLHLVPLLIYYFFFSGANYTISACLGMVFILTLNSGISETYAVWMFTLQSVGLIISGLAVPHLARFIGRKSPHILFPILISGLMFCFAFIKENTAGWVFGVIYLMYGIFTGATIPIGYALCKELVPPHVVSTATGLFNFAPALGGAIFQNTLPLLLASNAVAEYRTIAFILAGQYLLCAFIGAFLKETAGVKIQHPRVKSRSNREYMGQREDGESNFDIPLNTVKVQP